MRSNRIVLAVFLFVVAPIGAAVIISALLLFGATPHLVFAPGLAMRALLSRLGFQAPKFVGVVTTAALWWVIIVGLVLAWDARHRKG